MLLLFFLFLYSLLHSFFFFFFFNDTATTEIYTLSLHDALPIWSCAKVERAADSPSRMPSSRAFNFSGRDRKSTRLNSSHSQISYAVFCLKKKKKKEENYAKSPGTTESVSVRGRVERSVHSALKI